MFTDITVGFMFTNIHKTRTRGHQGAQSSMPKISWEIFEPENLHRTHRTYIVYTYIK